MNFKILIVIALFLFVGCNYEDERASDFSLSYDVSNGFFSGNKVSGTITNLSSSPADKITLKVDMYSNGSCADYDYITIYETLYQNSSVDFCVSLVDSITSVDVVISGVD